MNKIILTIILFLYSCPLREEKVNTDQNNFIDIVNQNRTYIIEKLRDTLLYPPRSISHISLFKNQISRDIDIQKKVEILHEIIRIGKRVSAIRELKITENNTFLTDYIEDEKMYVICLSAFNNIDFKIKEKAYIALLKHSRIDFLKKYSNQIRKGINEFRKDACKRYHWKACKEFCELGKDYKEIKSLLPGDELFLLLPLTIEEKKIMLNKDIKELHYRALLGDKTAETKLIQLFEKAKTYKTKRQLANKLGIIGTSQCAKALIKALNSPLKSKVPEFYSIRLDLIKSLGKIHPEASFLRMHSGFIGFYGDGYYGGKNKIKEYLQKVEDWAEKKYNVKPVGERPEPILRIIGVQL